MTCSKRRLMLGLVGALMNGQAFAATRHGAAITVSHAWSQPTPPAAPTAVGYLTIANAGARPDRLVSLASPAAATVGLHLMSMNGEVMRMRPVQGGLVVPAGRAIQLEPGGYHLMFEGLRRPFEAGDRIPLTLRFQRFGLIRTLMQVRGAGAGPMEGMAMPPARARR